jgi:D-xylose transport system ATP-binding protein
VIGEGQLRGDFLNQGLTQEQVLAAALTAPDAPERHDRPDRETA